jgi:hypothetical protein
MITRQVFSDEFTLPAHWASVLINLDYSGFTSDDEKEFDSFIDGQFDGGFCTVSLSDDEPEFRNHHDASNYGVKPCDCLRFMFTY